MDKLRYVERGTLGVGLRDHIRIEYMPLPDMIYRDGQSNLSIGAQEETKERRDG